MSIRYTWAGCDNQRDDDRLNFNRCAARWLAHPTQLTIEIDGGDLDFMVRFVNLPHLSR
ncbi:hypothetical protein [Methylomonas sp. AM2-LC]|uniref:hypothetical protein n=1 Tax=Methylomonas sp. AM2-LC TaxID=3153301 RepID=UPI00326420A2